MRIKAFLTLSILALLAACATTEPRPPTEPEAAPTAGPPFGHGPEDVAMAMDPESDPEPPGGRPVVTSIGDTTLFLENLGYDVVYSVTKLNALVVAYFLREHTDEDFDCPRPGEIAFQSDDRVNATVKKSHFAGTGYDRGHLAPNAAIATRYGCDAQLETFLMTNMTPQLPGLNQITWGGFENILDDVYANKFEGIWVLTGPVFHPTEIVSLLGREIEVPIEFWKIVIRRKPNGDVDAAGIVMTKQERRRGIPVSTFMTTIDDIESRTNIDFFPDLPPAEEQALESACPGTDWELDAEVTTSFAGTPREIREDAPQSRLQSLGTTVGQVPACAP